MAKSKVGLIGAGAIGRAHLVGAAGAEGVEIVGVADPNPASEDLATEFRVPWFNDHRALLDKVEPDGLIIATPNVLHVPMALECIELGKPVLVEKPITDTVEQGFALANAALKANIPLLVGHHRRYNPIVRTARDMVRSGQLGRLVSVAVLALFLKPESYYAQTWRRSAGGGPVLINMIHEVDLLRFVCGEVSSVQSVVSNKVRGYEVEDTAAALLSFANGAIATITLSDTATSPWSWDVSSGENPAFFRTLIESHFICGTDASIALPTLRIWRYPGERGWQNPLDNEQVSFASANPYVEQMRHFGAVIRREEDPLTNGFDATRTLEVTLAVKRAGESGETIRFSRSA